MMVIKLQWVEPNSGAAETASGTPHRTVRIFVGPDRNHLAKAGFLVFRPDEAARFRETVRAGIGAPGFAGIFEGGWDPE